MRNLDKMYWRDLDKRESYSMNISVEGKTKWVGLTKQFQHGAYASGVSIPVETLLSLLREAGIIHDDMS